MIQSHSQTSLGIRPTPSYLIAQIAKAHRKRADELLSAIGLHVGQEMIIDALWSTDAMSQSDLAKTIGVRKATVTISLKPLERDGLVERERDTVDHRVIQVRLTPKGREIGVEIRRAWTTLDVQTTNGLTDAELASLEVLLEKIQSNLVANPPT
jgi:DNA-binding MarR family transcriptional regulator